MSTQLITLRDSLGVEMMSLDKLMNTTSSTARLTFEKAKSKLSIYKAELENLIEEITIADVNHITELKKRAYRTLLDVRDDFVKIKADTKI